MTMGQGQAPMPRRARPPRFAGGGRSSTKAPGSPNGFSPIGGGAGSPLGPPPVGSPQGGDGAMGMYRNAILRRMQGTPGGVPSVGGPVAPGGPQMAPPGQPPAQMQQGGAEGVQGMIQNLLRTRNSRRVLGGASGPLGQ